MKRSGGTSFKTGLPLHKRQNPAFTLGFVALESVGTRRCET